MDCEAGQVLIISEIYFITKSSVYHIVTDHAFRVESIVMYHRISQISVSQSD